MTDKESRPGVKKHIITLGGLPGSGKSTVKKIISERLGYATFSTGDFARNLAIDRGMTIEAFNEVVAETREIDLLIDAKLEHIEHTADNIVVDSHLAFHFIPSGFSAFLDISLEESARRIFSDSSSEIRRRSGDTMVTLEEARERTEKRIQNHLDRYRRHYGINPYDVSQYDFVIDTMGTTPQQVADAIVTAFTRWIDT